MKVVAVVGTYRKDRVIDSAVDAALQGCTDAGAETEKIHLLDQHIEFCTNCRACTQQPGPGRGPCIHDDDMNAILDKLESADRIILASPVNFGTVTALMKRFIERLIVYGYWPWDIKKAPKMRHDAYPKRALLITSSMCPAVIGCLLMKNSLKILKAAAMCLGAKNTRSLYFGLVAIGSKDRLSEEKLQKARRAGQQLAAS